MSLIRLLPLLLLAALAGCDQTSSPPTPVLAEVGYVTLRAEPVALTAELSGRVAASRSSEVRPQVSGIVKRRLFEEGARITAGQVLYEIDPASYRATVDEAQAALASAEAAVTSAKLKDQRYAELRGIEAVSKQDADDAHSAYQQAVAAVAQRKAALETARINLGYTQVRAPISGRIGKSTVMAGSLVTAGQTTAMATIRALDPVYVDVSQSSADLMRLRRTVATGALQAGGAEVGLVLEDGTHYAARGRLKFAEVAVDEATGSVTLRAEFPNPSGALLPGMYVRATLDQAVDPQAILAPQQGIGRDPKGNATALVVTADNKVEQRAVQTQRAIGDKWLVSQGLKAGDRLVVQGTNRVKPGDTVRPVDVGTAASSTPASAASAARAGADASTGN